MRIHNLFLAACLCAPLWLGAEAETETETNPRTPPPRSELLAPRELRELLKGEKNAFAPAGELLFAMSDEERSKFEELYRKDRDAAKSFLLEKVEAAKRRKQELATEIQQVARNYRKSADEAEKEQLRTRLRELLTEQFNRASREIEVQLQLQELRLANVRRAYGKRLAESEKTIDTQLEKLTRRQPRRAKNPKKEQSGRSPETVPDGQPEAAGNEGK